MRKRLRLTLSCLLAAGWVMVALPRQARGQVLYGSVTGVVTDATGAVIPGAEVTITNDRTGFARTATTDSDGRYRLLDLPEGTYTISVAAKGFQAFRKTNVTVVIGQVNEQDLQLAVGATTQEVTVQASAAVLQTQKADVHTEISSYAIENLPLSTYRNFQATELLAPGVFSTSGIANSYPNSIADTPDRSFEIYSNGLPGHDNTTRVDGATNIFIWLPDHMLIVPPQETIQEVNVQTADYDVEKGLTGGAAVDVVTKSGTNELHGSLYGFHTDNALDARNWFNYTGNSKNIINNDGATVGGPIKKDKLFYFANWDETWQRQNESFTDLLPPVAYRNGDFSSALGPQLFGPNGQVLTVCTTEGATVPLQEGMVFDPASGNPTDGTDRCVFSSAGQLNVIPPGRLNSGAQNYWKLLAAPNLNVPLTLTTPYNYAGSKTARFNRQDYTGKVDWNMNDRHTVWVKWTGQLANYLEPFDLGAAGGNGTGTAHQWAQIATLGHTWTLSPTLVLTGHVGFDRMSEHAEPPGYGQPLGQSILGIAGTNTPAGDIRYTGLPGIYIQGFSGLGSLNSWEPAQRNDWTFTTSHNLTWVRGAHEFRMGLDAAHNHLNAFQPEIFCCPRGAVYDYYGGTSINLPANPATPDNGNFLPLFTAGGASAGTGYAPFLQNSTALFDMGYISEAQNDEQYIKSTGKDWQWGLYFGDRWKVTPKLTADLGIRWEYFPLITRDGIDKDELYVPATNTLLFGGLGGNPPHLGITTSKKLFTPRIGLAYEMNEKTVLRAGFGISNDTTPLERPLRGFFPLAIGADNFVPSSHVSGFLPYDTFAQGVPVIQPVDLSSGRINPPTNVTVGTLGPGRFNRGYVESWNFFVERQLPGQVLFNIGYVGNHYVHEFNGRDLNAAPLYAGSVGQPLAVFGRFIPTYQFAGYLDSHYNSLQVSVSRKTSHGLFLQGAYTYSKAMSYVDDNTWENGLRFNCPPSPAMPQGCQPLNYSPAGFDHTHIFKLAYVYDLPFGAGKKWASGNNVANAIVGGWQFSGIFTAFTGDPLQIGQNVGNLNTPGTPQVPIFVGPVQYLHGQTQNGFPRWFNPTAFVPNTSTTNIGNIPRRLSWLRGPGLWQLDSNLARHFRISERLDLEFRAEAENLFNVHHFSDPGTFCTDVNGVCGGSFGRLTSAYGQRLIQLGAFLRF